jgi:hypothetical protein
MDYFAFSERSCQKLDVLLSHSNSLVIRSVKVFRRLQYVIKDECARKIKFSQLLHESTKQSIQVLKSETPLTGAQFQLETPILKALFLHKKINLTPTHFHLKISCMGSRLSSHSVFVNNTFRTHSFSMAPSGGALYYLLLNPLWHGGILLFPCPFWVGICQLTFYQNFPNFFGGER